MDSRLPHSPECVPSCQSKGCRKAAIRRSLCLGKATLTTTYCHQHYADFRRLLAAQGREFGGGRRQLEDGTSYLTWRRDLGRTDSRSARYFYASRRGYHSY